MNAAEFLHSAHSALAAIIEQAGLDALPAFTLAIAAEGPVAFRALDGEGRPAQLGGLVFIKQYDPPFALFGFDVADDCPPGCPFDVLIAGTYYEREAELIVRPFLLEYTASPARLGWYEFAPAPDLSPAERAKVEAAIAEQNRLTREGLAQIEVRRGAPMRAKEFGGTG